MQDHLKAQSLGHASETIEHFMLSGPLQTFSVSCKCEFPIPIKVKNMFLRFAIFSILEISMLCFLSPDNGVYATFLKSTLIMMYNYAAKLPFFTGFENFLPGHYGSDNLIK